MGIANTTARKEVPGEPGAFLTIRQLNWMELDEAKDQRMQKIMKSMQLLAGLKDALPTSVAQAAQQEIVADRLLEYDRFTLLKYGVKEWTYNGPIEVATFDEPTADWAAREILKLSRPDEDEIGKKSSSSTGT